MRCLQCAGCTSSQNGIRHRSLFKAGTLESPDYNYREVKRSKEEIAKEEVPVILGTF